MISLVNDFKMLNQYIEDVPGTLSVCVCVCVCVCGGFVGAGAANEPRPSLGREKR